MRRVLVDQTASQSELTVHAVDLLDSKTEKAIFQLEIKFGQLGAKFEQLEAKLDNRITQLDTRLTQVENNMATKSDLHALRMELKSDIKLLHWMFGFMLTGISTLVFKAFA